MKNKNNNKVTLFVMSQKGFAVLQHTAEHYKELIGCVVASNDSNVKHDYYKEIKEFCKLNHIQCMDRRDNKTVDTNYAFAISWRWLLPTSSSKLIVFHDSLLPKYRGFNPLVTMLINGEKRIGVTALFASEKYDRGDIIGQENTEITYPIKINTAIEKVSENYKELACKILKLLKENKTIVAQKQNDKDATYSLWRDDDDYRIDWNDDANTIKRFVDAVGFPYKGAASIVENNLIRIFDVEEVTDVIIKNRTPGKIIFIEDGFPIIVCGIGLLKITNLRDDNDKSLLPFKKFRVRFT